jgi:hypothetical protein
VWVLCKGDRFISDGGSGTNAKAITPIFHVHNKTHANTLEYAQCVKMLGNGRLEAKCQDGETRLGQIRGQMRKKVRYLLRPLGRRVVQPSGYHFY